MVMSHQQNSGHNHSLLNYNKFFESVVKFKYLGISIQMKFEFMKKLRAD